MSAQEIDSAAEANNKHDVLSSSPLSDVLERCVKELQLTTTLDETQLEAVKHSLSNRVAIIQVSSRLLRMHIFDTFVLNSVGSSRNRKVFRRSENCSTSFFCPSIKRLLRSYLGGL